MNKTLFAWLDKNFIEIDRSHILRTKNIRLIPNFKDRRGGKLSYAEWAHVTGIFQTLMYQNLIEKTGNNILDIGCGTGLLGIAAEPFLFNGGNYTGIDVMSEDIDFCEEHFPAENYKFIHFNVANPTYANDQSKELIPWPIEDDSQDLAVALSVWTHLSEPDAIFYFKEITRVLKKGKKAIVTFFILDDDYIKSLKMRSQNIGRFHNTSQMGWIFDIPAYASKNWFTVKTAINPEDAIGVTQNGLDLLIEESGLKLVQHYPGNWKESPGVFFQDVLIFEK